jgi:hypothetical protein
MAVDGSWSITMNTPMGAQQATLVLASDGDTLNGNMQSPMGGIELSDGKIDGDNLTWKASMTSPMPMTLDFKAKVDGDEISGEVALGSFGNATFAGTRS